MAQPPRDVCALVVYQASEAGRTALRHAAGLARSQGRPLVVLAVSPQASVTSGCLRCRGSAQIWNVAMDEVAEDELAQARELLGDEAPQDVRYVLWRGRDEVRAIADAASELGADPVIVPGGPAHRLPLPRRRSLASRLGGQRPFAVLCPPPTT